MMNTLRVHILFFSSVMSIMLVFPGFFLTKSLVLAQSQETTLRIELQLKRGAGSITDVTVSPKKNLVAIATTHGVELRKGNDFSEIFDLPTPFLHAAFSRVRFNDDATLIAASGLDHLFIWSVDTSKPVALINMDDRVSSFDFIPDTSEMAIGLENKGLLIWDYSQSRPVASYATTSGIIDVLFHPGSRKLYYSTSDGNGFYSISLAMEEQPKHYPINPLLVGEAIRKEYQPSCERLSLFSSNNLIVCATSYGTVQFWDPQGERQVQETGGYDVTHPQVFTASQHSRAIIMRSTSKSLKIVHYGIKPSPRRMKDGSKGELWIPGHARQCALWPDGSKVLIVLTSGRIWVLDTETAKKKISVNHFDRFGLKIQRMVFSNNGRIFATGNSFGDIQVFRTDDLERIQKFTGRYAWNSGKNVTALAFSADDRFVASGQDDQLIKIWSVEDGKQYYILRHHARNIYGLQFVKDGTGIVSSAMDGTICIWNLAEKKCRWEIRHGSYGFAPIYVDQNDRLYTVFDDKLHIYDIKSQELSESIELPQSVLPVLSIMPRTGTGALLIVGMNGAIAEWQPETRELAAHSFDGSFLKGQTLHDVSLFDNGNKLMTVSYQESSWRNRILFWKWGALMVEPLNELKQLSDEVPVVAMSPDGKHLLLGGDADTIELFDLR